MPEKCVSLGCPEVIRLALQDPCSGAPVPGAGNGMVLRCQRNVTIEAVLQDADISTFTSDCGIPDEYQLDAFVKGYTVSFEGARISPELQALLLGYPLLAIDGDNVGFIEEAVAGCSATPVRPTFVVEAFFRVRQCDPTGEGNYLRRVIQGVKFAPVEQDKEGQIVFERYSGTSVPSLTAGLFYEDGATDVGGPYQDFPQDIVDQIGALPDGHLNIGLRFVDPIDDPLAGLVLTAGTCYTATVPAAPVP